MAIQSLAILKLGTACAWCLYRCSRGPALEETTVGVVHAPGEILTKATVSLNKLVWQQVDFLNW
jgi:hypothetical protein